MTYSHIGDYTEDMWIIVGQNKFQSVLTVISAKGVKINVVDVWKYHAGKVITNFIKHQIIPLKIL